MTFSTFLENCSDKDSLPREGRPTITPGSTPQQALSSMEDTLDWMVSRTLALNHVISVFNDFVFENQGTDDIEMLNSGDLQKFRNVLIDLGIEPVTSNYDPFENTWRVAVGQAGGVTWYCPITIKGLWNASAGTWRPEAVSIFGCSIRFEEDGYGDLYYMETNGQYTGLFESGSKHASVDSVISLIYDTCAGDNILTNLCAAYQNYGTLDAATLASIFSNAEAQGAYVSSLRSYFTSGVCSLSRTGFISMMSPILEEEKTLYSEGDGYEFRDDFTTVTAMVSVVCDAIGQLISTVLGFVFSAIGLWAAALFSLLQIILRTVNSFTQPRTIEMSTGEDTFQTPVIDAPLISIASLQASLVPSAIREAVDRFSLASFTAGPVEFFVWSNGDATYNVQFFPALISRVYNGDKVRFGITTQEYPESGPHDWVFGSDFNIDSLMSRLVNPSNHAYSYQYIPEASRNIRYDTITSMAGAICVLYWMFGAPVFSDARSGRYTSASAKTFITALASGAATGGTDNPYLPTLLMMCAFPEAVEVFNYYVSAVNGEGVWGDSTGYSARTFFHWNTDDLIDGRIFTLWISLLRSFNVDFDYILTIDDAKLDLAFAPTTRVQSGLSDFNTRIKLPNVTTNDISKALIITCLTAAAIGATALAVKKWGGTYALRSQAKASKAVEEARARVLSGKSNGRDLYSASKRLRRANKLASFCGVSTVAPIVNTKPNSTSAGEGSDMLKAVALNAGLTETLDISLPDLTPSNEVSLNPTPSTLPELWNNIQLLIAGPEQ